MCVVSFAMDHYIDKWQHPPYAVPYQVPYKGGPWVVPSEIPGYPYTPAPQPETVPYNPVWPQQPMPQPTEPRLTPDEIAELRKLLDGAMEYDKRNNEPDCELEEKKKKLLELAKQLGVEIDFL